MPARSDDVLAAARDAIACGKPIPDRGVLEEAARGGDVEAQYLLGMALRDEPETGPAEEWLGKAAAAGHREAMHQLGEWMLSRFDEEHHVDLLDPALHPEPRSRDIRDRLEYEAGLSPAERARFAEGSALRDRATRWLAAAAEAGDAEASGTLADFLSRQGTEEGRRDAVRWYERAANLGDVLSMETFARILKSGSRVPADPAAAQRWFEKAAARFEEAARRGDRFGAIATSHLAEFHLRGDGVPRDVERAVALFEESAARGYGWGLLTLGECYERGDGVPRDLARAEACYARSFDVEPDAYAKRRLDDVREEIRREADTTRIGGVAVSRALLPAAEGGDPDAIFAIARALETEGDRDEAASWMRRAALAGHAVAAFTLALENGMGWPDEENDGAEGRRWLRLAAANGYVTAWHVLGEQHLDPDAKRLDPGLGHAWIELGSRERNAHPAVTATILRSQAKARAADVWAALSDEQRERSRALVERCDAGPPHRLPDEVS